jgi:ribonuclease-3
MITKERERELADLERKLGITFLNKALLNQALTHSSYAHEVRQKGISDNERLEFLGDAVLKVVMSEYLYNKFPDRAEGDLTKIRATAVSDETLAVISGRLKIGSYLLLGANERRSGGRERRSNLANTFEAILAAIYLDGGLGKARDFILDFLRADIEKISSAGFIKDFKSALQELVQKKGWGLPNYRVVRESGPKHKKVFFIDARIKGKSFGQGKGFSKKEAEQEAAKRAYQSLTGRGRRRAPFRGVRRFIRKVVRKKDEG